MLKPVLPLTEVDDFGDGKKDLLPLVLLFFGVFLYFSRRSFEESGVTGSDFRLLGLKSLRICSITLLASASLSRRCASFLRAVRDRQLLALSRFEREKYPVLLPVQELSAIYREPLGVALPGFLGLG